MKYYLTQEGREFINEMDPKQVTGSTTRTLHSGYESDARDPQGVGGNRQRALAAVTKRELGRVKPIKGEDVGGIQRRDARRSARKSANRAFARVLPSTDRSQAASNMGSIWPRTGPTAGPQASRLKRTAKNWKGERPHFSSHDTTLEPGERRPMAGPKKSNT